MRTPADAFLDPMIRNFLRITTVPKGTTVYVEIYRRLRRLIESGVLKEGDPLPGEAQLASIMCVGRTSLRTALSTLYEDGYIATAKGRGSVVLGDSRQEKYRRAFPSDILLARDRISLLGELTVLESACDIIGDDDFLTEKLAAAPGSKVIQFQQVYQLDGKPAVISFHYFNNDLFPFSVEDDAESIYAALHTELITNTVTAEYECLTVQSGTYTGLHRYFPSDRQTLVMTNFVGGSKILAFAKDYYNNDVMRFRFAMQK